MTSDTAVYILELEPIEDDDARWYVGISEDPETRLEQHRKGTAGAAWTRRNKVLEQYVLGTTDRREAKRIENHLTAVLMREFGRESTRGGDYAKAELLSYPELGRAELAPGHAQRFEEIENEDLRRLAEKGTVYAEFSTTISFEDDAEAVKWADKHLPPGVEVDLYFPPTSYSSDSSFITRPPEGD